MVSIRGARETGNMKRGKICTISSRNTSNWVCPVDFDGGREMSNLSLKTVLVHNSVTPLVIETNLQKVGLVHRVPCAKSREKLHNSFREYACCFVNINTITYFILFVCPLKQRNNVCNDQSAKFYSLIFNFSTLYVVHNLIFLRKLTNPAF